MPDDDSPQLRSPPNWTTIALIAGLILLLVLVGYFTTNRDSDQDKLTGSELSTAAGDTPEKACSSKATYDLIKRELFRRALAVRGSDQAAYEKVSGAAVIRMENPVMESEDGSTGAINCSGSASIDLPPGIVADGGRRTLMSDIDYTVDASGSVTLRNANSIIAPLATLARVAQQPPAAPDVATEMEPEASEGTAPAPEPAPPPPGAGTNNPGRPSFNCAKATTRGEVFVCGDAGLAALDRNMAAQFGRAMSRASPDERAILQSTRSRFLTYRDRCPDRQCIGDAYVGRMQEIRDIMEGRWQPER